MKCDISILTKFVVKATLNNSIDNVQLVIKDDYVVSNMTSPTKEFRTSIKFKNFFDDVDDLILNFADQNNYLLRLISLLDSKIVNMKVTKKSLILKDNNNKVTISFCSPLIVDVSANKDVPNVEYFSEFDIDSTFLEIWDKIKKIGTIYGKIYFDNEDGKLFINVTDKTSGIEHGFRHLLIDSVDVDGYSGCFNFVNFMNMMNCLDSKKHYKLKLHYNEKANMMILACISNDNNYHEEYYLKSFKDV